MRKIKQIDFILLLFSSRMKTGKGRKCKKVRLQRLYDKREKASSSLDVASAASPQQSRWQHPTQQN